MDPEVNRLKDELSRVIAHRFALQEALAAAESERNALRTEGESLR